jgi:hypothetical protein
VHTGGSVVGMRIFFQIEPNWRDALVRLGMYQSVLVPLPPAVSFRKEYGAMPVPYAS